MALVLKERSGYVSGTRRVARYPFDRDKTYTLRFFPDGSSNGMRARLGPEIGGYIVTVNWLLGGASITRARDDAI